jgi:hypothetical protein
LPDLLANCEVLHTPVGSDPVWDLRVAGWLNAVRAKVRSGVSAPDQIRDVRAAVNDMRLFKDDHELAIMRRAAEISSGAHARAMAAARPGKREYEIEAELLHEFVRNGARSPAYGSIVAAGPNACVLHYRENSRQLQDGELLLIDAGCEYQGYASDITRTFPVNGRFTGPQKAIYRMLTWETGTFELPRRDGRLLDFGGFANLFVGGVTGIAILLVFPPSSVTIQGAGGAGATVVSGYDPIRLAVTALVAGSAGGSVLTSLQARIGAALSEAKVQLTKQTSQLEIDRLGDESTRAATEALRALASASPTPAAMSTPRRRRPGAGLDVPPMAPAADALGDAIASVTSAITARADQAKANVASVAESRPGRSGAAITPG